MSMSVMFASSRDARPDLVLGSHVGDDVSGYSNSAAVGEGS